MTCSVLIAVASVLRDDALEPELAGVPEDGLTASMCFLTAKGLRPEPLVVHIEMSNDIAGPMHSEREPGNTQRGFG
jgi:hypothetical protein